MRVSHESASAFTRLITASRRGQKRLAPRGNLLLVEPFFAVPNRVGHHFVYPNAQLYIYMSVTLNRKKGHGLSSDLNPRAYSQANTRPLDAALSPRFTRPRFVRTVGRRSEHRQSRGGSEAEPDAREWDRDLQGQTEEEEQSARRKLACGLCGAMLNPEDVSFGLTKKMVRETLFHVSEQASERT